MISTTLKKNLGLICSAALIFTMAGCSCNDSDVKQLKDGEGGSASTEATEQVTQNGEIGKKSEMADVEIQVNKIYRSEYYGAQSGTPSNVVFLDVTISNNTENELEPNMLTSFEFNVDGKLHDSATLLAIRSAKKQFGNDVDLFSESLGPGESRTGYIPAELPKNFYEATLNVLPLGGIKGGGDTSKAIVYTFTKDDLEDIAKPDEQKSTEKTEKKSEE